MLFPSAILGNNHFIEEGKKYVIPIPITPENMLFQFSINTNFQS